MKKLKKLTFKAQMPEEELKHLLGGFTDLARLADYDCNGMSGCQDGCKEQCKPGCKTCQSQKK